MEKNRMLSVTGISQAMKAQKISLITKINKASNFENNNIVTPSPPRLRLLLPLVPFL